MGARYRHDVRQQGGMNGRAACRIWEMNSGRNRGEFMDNVRIIRLAWRQWWCATDVRPLFGDQWPLCGYGRAVRANWPRTPSLAYSGRVSARKMPLSGPKKTARLPACVGAEAAFGHRSGRFSASVFSCRVWPDRYTKTLYPPRTTCERLVIRGLARARVRSGALAGVRAPCAGPRASWPRSCRHGCG